MWALLIRVCARVVQKESIKELVMTGKLRVGINMLHTSFGSWLLYNPKPWKDAAAMVFLKEHYLLFRPLFVKMLSRREQRNSYDFPLEAVRCSILSAFIFIRHLLFYEINITLWPLSVEFYIFVDSTKREDM